MACGVPLVITRDGGSADYAKDGWNCLKVDVKDPYDAIQKLDRLLKDERLRNKLIKNGLETASKFTWRKSAKDFMLQVKKAIEYGKRNTEGNPSVS